MSILSDALEHSWNAFMTRDPPKRYYSGSDSVISTYRPDRSRLTRGNEKSIVNSIYTRLAMDCAAIDIEHVRLDDNGRYIGPVDSGLNYCLTVEANLDQTARAFKQDVFMSLLDEGCIAVVPVDTTIDPRLSSAFDVKTLRVGKIVEWMPQLVKVRVYNELRGIQEEIVVPKKTTAIIENPFYSVMNEPNSTLQRLIRKLNLLDAIDEQSGAGKLDLIVQLPYNIKTEARKEQAENRRKELEDQLANSKYGIAYTDGTEHITQLNRPIENNLMKQIEYLTTLLYSQLGMTTAIMDGTAKEEERLAYINGTIEPIVSAFSDEIKRKFLSKTARSYKQSVMFFRDPFKLVPVSNLADIADKFTRNEIMSSNEIRQVVGMKPVNSPEADELRNKNINAGTDQSFATTEEPNAENNELDLDEYNQQMSDLEKNEAELDELESMVNDDELKHYASPYYDPEYAHQYYEEHKQLKGRKASLNDEGKAAAEYVKKNLYEERDSIIKDHKTDTDNRIASNKSNTQTEIKTTKTKLDSELKNRKTTMDNQIKTLKSQLKSMSKEEKAARRDEFNEQISNLRSENRELKSALMDRFREYRTDTNNTMREENRGYNEDHRQFKKDVTEEYKNKYASELDSIANDPSFQKQKKEKTTKSKSSKKTSSDSSANYSKYKERGKAEKEAQSG